ncbi:hypothetical protein BHYA_0400g00010 [Botrytis hyacinthi]|uniref:Uncharacterized protein n=1 Tax=Botrytis hyacinthi TaxID=278943 RepID=A0A4Z1G8T4_9HELO|nr:hypothetical protein BHYA_0400g00010 [Botrytis hyacinthi]
MLAFNGATHREAEAEADMVAQRMETLGIRHSSKPVQNRNVRRRKETKQLFLTMPCPAGGYRALTSFPVCIDTKIKSYV